MWFRQKPKILSIAVAILCIAVFVFAACSGGFRLPQNAGGWLYEYQILISGIFAFLGGIFVVSSTRESISFQKRQKEDDVKRQQDKMLTILYNDTKGIGAILLEAQKQFERGEIRQWMSQVKKVKDLNLGPSFWDASLLSELEPHNFNKIYDFRETFKDAKEQLGHLCSPDKATALYPLDQKEWPEICHSLNKIWLSYNSAFHESENGDFESLADKAKRFVEAENACMNAQ